MLPLLPPCLIPEIWCPICLVSLECPVWCPLVAWCLPTACPVCPAWCLLEEWCLLMECPECLVWCPPEEWCLPTACLECLPDPKFINASSFSWFNTILFIDCSFSLFYVCEIVIKHAIILISSLLRKLTHCCVFFCQEHDIIIHYPLESYQKLYLLTQGQLSTALHSDLFSASRWGSGKDAWKHSWLFQNPR